MMRYNIQMTIKTAIIPVAGYGTRRLPITKAIEKCMLPVGNRPIVDYVVEDCLRAGVRDIWFVVGEESDQLSKYYGRNIWLEQYLAERGKTKELAMIQPLPRVNFHYLVQSQTGKYGTTIPVALAAGQIGFKEPVAVLMGDDFIYRRDGGSTVKDLAKGLHDSEAVMLGVEIPREQVSGYGVLKYHHGAKTGARIFESIVEKPTVEAAPSNLINVSKYIFPPRLLKMVYEASKIDMPESARQAGEEYKITDPINQFVAAGGIMKIARSSGEYLDSGTLPGWLHANAVVGADLVK
jgi:UTP--glucose-1-phosphate uridylyltransferase